jgi:peptidoglycan/xylan/chitin deacetylase (PgdA/CDA1 family)
MRVRKKVGIFFAVAILLCGTGVVFLRCSYVPPILMYHAVYPGATYANRLSVSTETFEWQMGYLKQHGYRVIPLEELVALTATHAAIPPKTVVITFDDGYQNDYTYAFPILKKYRFAATIFVIFNEVGRPDNDRLTWEMIKEMRDSGLIYFGSHTLGAEPLINIKSDNELRRQIVESKRALEEKLGKEVKMFSYPEGKISPLIRRMVIDAGYLGAVATHPPKKYGNNDLFALRRVRVSENSRNSIIFSYELSGYYPFFKKHKKRK